MVDRHKGATGPVGQGLGEGKPDQERAHESRACGDSNPIQGFKVNPRFRQSRLGHRRNHPGMVPGGQFGDDTPIRGVHIVLARDDAGQHMPT